MAVDSISTQVFFPKAFPFPRFLTLATLAYAATAIVGSCGAGTLPEYTAAEAKQHIGEKAIVVGTIDCIGHGRRHIDLQIGGCPPNTVLWIVLPNDSPGPEVDPETLRGVTVAITGKIESSGEIPQITVKSTKDLQARSVLRINYIGSAYGKETKGDIDGAIEDLDQAVEHQPARRDEACQHLALLKEKKGDWVGALATYDRLVALDPNKSGSYYVRATAKKQHGDFEGAMADFTRAAELRSSGISFVEIGDMRKANGDSTGAMAEYGKAIAMLDSQIAGLQKPSDRLDLLYYHRGYAKELKGDVDGAVADYSQAIAIKPSYEAGAFSRRGDIKKARGDLSGAIADYQFAVKFAQLPEDNEKLKKARAEAKTRPKNVATQPNIQAAQNEASLNKSEETPESIAEAFVQAYSGADIDTLAALYADRVDHTNSGVISNAAVRAQAKEYFARWPVRHWSLVGTVNTVSLRTSKKKVIFSATYDASDPQTNRHASGIAKETLILATDPSGAMKIVSQKEQTSKRNTSQLTEQRSEDLDFDVAKAESGQQTGLACKLVGQGDDKYVLNGHVQRHMQSGGETLEGNTGLPWAAALAPNGKLLWAAKMQIIQPVGSASGYGLTTDGDYLWLAVVLNNGAFQLARFKARTLERDAAVQTEFQVTQKGSMRIGPWFQFYPQTEGDLQVSVHRTFPDSIKVVVFSRELRPILDKIYSIPDRLAGKESEPLSGTSLIRIPDRTGYYLVLEPQVIQGKRAPRIGIIRLDNTGAIKWANVYTTGHCDNRETRVADDGAILVSLEAGSQESPRSTLIKIRPDGTVNWATAVEGIYISFQNFAYYDPSYQSAPYRFTQPFLLTIGGQPDDLNQPSWLVKWYAVLFRLNYETGGIEKQIKFGANTPGKCSFMDHDANSFYIGFANEQSLDKPSAHGGRHARPNVINYHAAVLRFDYNLSLLAAEKVREAGSANLPVLHLFEPDSVVISHDGSQGTVIIETTNANLESSNACRWLDKESFTFTKSNFEQHQVDVASSPLTSITVSNGNSKINDADLSLVPLNVKVIPCSSSSRN